MLDCDVTMCAGSIAARKEQAFEREIVGFAAAAREDDLIGGTTEECRDLRRAPSKAALPLALAQWPLDGLP